MDAAPRIQNKRQIELQFCCTFSFCVVVVEFVVIVDDENEKVQIVAKFSISDVNFFWRGCGPTGGLTKECGRQPKRHDFVTNFIQSLPHQEKRPPRRSHERAWKTIALWRLRNNQRYVFLRRYWCKAECANTILRSYWCEAACTNAVFEELLMQSWMRIDGFLRDTECVNAMFELNVQMWFLRSCWCKTESALLVLSSFFNHVFWLCWDSNVWVIMQWLWETSMCT